MRINEEGYLVVVKFVQDRPEHEGICRAWLESSEYFDGSNRVEIKYKVNLTTGLFEED